MQRDKLLTKYYNKHKEDLRLVRRHGMVEFRVSMHYIKKFLPENCNGLKILDLGAATGRYSFALAELGCDVTAVELVKQNHYDIILMDHMMPGMDGLQLCVKVRGNVRLNHIPIILLTAKVTEQEKIEAKYVSLSIWAKEICHL